MKKAILLLVCFMTLPTVVFCQEITPNQLREEFKANEFAFEEKYKGKEITITGEVDEVGRQVISGQPKISFDAGGWYTVQCRFPEKVKLSLAKISAGDELSVIAIYDTKAVMTLFFDCELCEQP